ncbi:MAG: Ig-like domain-containing protein, partial [Gammaproteobacteria bacterium]|nr:Ig-like domain-containing protein [Gammaproteobacteria bacterium]
MKRFILLSLVISIVLACGGGGTPVLNNLYLESSEPADGASDVPPNQLISLRFFEELQGSSVNSKTVHLLPLGGNDISHTTNTTVDDDEYAMEVINVQASYNEATRQIQILPQMSLNNGMSYKVHFSGLKLKDGTVVATGTKVVPFSFTVAHTHEIARTRYGQESDIPVAFESITIGYNNKVEKREYFKANGFGSKSRRPERIRFYDTTLTTGDDVNWAEYDEDDILLKYEKLVSTKNDRFIRASYVLDASGNANVISWWSDRDVHGSHGRHEITRHFRAAGNLETIGVQLNAENPEQGFELMHASLLEADHSLVLPNDGMYPYRHIFYNSLGNNGVIDFDNKGNPRPVDDVVEVWHTREYQNGKRKYDWAWLGNRQRNSGEDILTHSEGDLASRVRVYEYDGQHRRIKRTAYEDVNGKTRADWLSEIDAASANLYLRGWREYIYDTFSGNLSEVYIVDKCSETEVSTGRPMSCVGYQAKSS